MNLIFKNGKIYDGLGSKPVTGNICVKGDRIIYTPDKESPKKADRVIDIEELAIAPGFINIHSHSDMALLVDGSAPSCICQGITTEVMGNCGYSLAPLAKDSLDEIQREFKKVYGRNATWKNFREYFSILEETGISPNIITLVGHGTLRGSVVGAKDREPSREEMEKMKENLAEAMEDGAAGFSTGLIYPPGCYSKTEELIELAKTVKDYRGFYSTHMRGEGETLIEAIREAVAIGSEGGIPVEISHLKAAGEKNLGKTKEALQVIRDARKKGLFIQHDQYPYTASSTGLSMMVPTWVQDGGTDAAIARLRDDETRGKIKKEMEESAYKNGRNVLISYVNLEKNEKYEGSFLNEAAEVEGKEIFDFVLDLLLEEEVSVGAIYMSMDEEDVCRVMADPYTAIGNDASAHSISGPLRKGKPHPRTYGTFPRVLRRYSRELDILTLEDAIRKMTFLPARMLGLKDRGVIRNGYFADLVVFNPRTIEDTATFTEPHSYPKGIEYVVVNGQIVFEKGEILPVRPGKVLRRQGR